MESYSDRNSPDPIGSVQHRIGIGRFKSGTGRFEPDSVGRGQVDFMLELCSGQNFSTVAIKRRGLSLYMLGCMDHETLYPTMYIYFIQIGICLVG